MTKGTFHMSHFSAAALAAAKNVTNETSLLSYCSQGSGHDRLDRMHPVFGFIKYF